MAPMRTDQLAKLVAQKLHSDGIERTPMQVICYAAQMLRRQKIPSTQGNLRKMLEAVLLDSEAYEVAVSLWSFNSVDD